MHPQNPKPPDPKPLKPEAIHMNYAPRQIYIICQEEVRDTISGKMVEWRLPSDKVGIGFKKY